MDRVLLHNGMHPSFKLVYGYLAYYMHLNDPKVIRMIRYVYKGKGVIYIIRNTVTGMLYVGSTLSPSLRFHDHLVNHNTNAALQSAISHDGQSKFVIYIMQEVVFPAGLSFNEKLNHLRVVEQSYMDKYHADQLYNLIRSSIQS